MYDFFSGDIVGFAAQVFAEFAFRECAELAFEVANIGVVDVAINHKAHRFAVGVSAQAVCGLYYSREIIFASAEQRDKVVFDAEGFPAGKLTLTLCHLVSFSFILFYSLLGLLEIVT